MCVGEAESLEGKRENKTWLEILFLKELSFSLSLLLAENVLWGGILVLFYFSFVNLASISKTH